MIDPIGKTKEAPLLPALSPQRIAFQGKSTLDPAKTGRTFGQCLIDYFKRIGQNFIAMFGAFWELLQVIFCCKLKTELDWENAWRLPETGGADHLRQLDPITDVEMKNIFFVIHTISNTNLLELVPLEEELRKRGDAIEHVHPFRFFEYVLKHPTLKADLKQLSNAFIPFVWSNFQEGLEKRFEKAKDKGDVAQHLEGFAEVSGVNKSKLESLIKENKWKELIKSLI